MANTALLLRGLIPSAAELKAVTNWEESVIEDYLSAWRNLVLLADILDTKANLLKTTSVIDTVTYTILDTDEEVYFDTNLTPIAASLPVGINGRKFRLHNIGAAGNDVTLTPNGTEKLFGVNAPERIADGEVLVLTFETVNGWD